MTNDFIPREYQKIMIDYLVEKERAALWIFMGAGKTVVTLSALEILSVVEDVYPALIIAPLRVARNVWGDESAKWKHLSRVRISKILGTLAERKKAISVPAEIYTINLENIGWLVESLKDKWPFKTIVVDESSRLSGFRVRQGSARAKALAKVAFLSKRFYALTGTPVAGGIEKLWGQTWFLDKGERLGKTFTAFSQRWFRPDWSGYNLLPLPHAQKEIEAKLSDVCLSLKAKDYFDLKEPIINKIYVDLPPKARVLYKTMEKELFVKIKEHEVEAFNAASMTIKVQQLAQGALYVEEGQKYEEIHKAKIEALESIVEEAAGAPVLVAYTFKSDLSRLRMAFPRSRVLDADPKTIKDWNLGKIPILFAHPISCGHGLNLAQGGNILAFFGIGWNLEEHMQIQERIGVTRQAQLGLDRPVFIHYILAKNTIDEQIMERLESKRSVQDILLEAMKVRS